MTKSRNIYERHGMKRTSTYITWCSMNGRCKNPDNKAYHNYGARGIVVCPRWSKFTNFLKDMGERPAGTTLERIDNNRGYEPENCKWASRIEQGRNRRGLVQITIEGVTHPLSVWIERIGKVNYKTAHQRIAARWNPKAAIVTPLVTRRKGIPRGSRIGTFAADTIVKTNFGEIPLWRAIEKCGLSAPTVMRRIKRGWSVEAALALRPRKGPRKEAFGAQQGVIFRDTPQEDTARETTDAAA